MMGYRTPNIDSIAKDGANNFYPHEQFREK